MIRLLKLYFFHLFSVHAHACFSWKKPNEYGTWGVRTDLCILTNILFLWESADRYIQNSCHMDIKYEDSIVRCKKDAKSSYRIYSFPDTYLDLFLQEAVGWQIFHTARSCISFCIALNHVFVASQRKEYFTF